MKKVSIVSISLFLIICCSCNNPPIEEQEDLMEISSLSTFSIKYGDTLSIIGKGFKSSIEETSIYLTDNTKTYTLHPEFVSPELISVTIYNHENPYQLLDMTYFYVGVHFEDTTIWSETPVSFKPSWTKVQDFPGAARYKSASFSIGSKCYVGAGAGTGVVFKDFWEYNPSSNSWSQKADLPGVARVYPKGFSNSSNGFIGSGYTSETASKIQLYDFYKYSPGNNSWSNLADYPDNILNYYVGFAVTVNNRSFISLSNSVLTMRELVNDEWVSKSTIQDLTESPAAGVLPLNGKIYVVIGYRTNNTSSNAVWEYSPELGIWNRKSDFPGIARFAPLTFTIKNYGYYGCGMSTDLTQYKDMWRYDPSADKWIRYEDFPGNVRSHLVGISCGDYGFGGLGLIQSTHTLCTDFYKFDGK
jgi:N-acetylneuraminic acid mutarotase